MSQNIIPASTSSVQENATHDNDTHDVNSPKKGLSGRERSSVWQHFSKETRNGKDVAICDHCHKHLGGNSKHGTSHLRDHLKVCRQLKLIERKQKVLTSDMTSAKGKFTSYAFDPDVGRHELVSAIILHEYPLSIVDHVGFRRYSRAIQPLFSVPSRNTIKNDIMKIYEVEKEKTSMLLHNNISRVAITTDLWTCSNQKRGFMVVTSHFIDSSWNLQSRIIRYIFNLFVFNLFCFGF